MDLTEIRDNFSICILDENQARSKELFEALQGHGYFSRMLKTKAQFDESIKVSPPHVIVYVFDGSFVDDVFIKSIFYRLPESHLILVATDLTLLNAVEYLNMGACDCIEYPLMGGLLTKSVDRAVERDHLFYENEQIKQTLGSIPMVLDNTLPENVCGNMGGNVGGGEVFNSSDLSWLNTLNEQSSLDQVIQEYLQYLSTENTEAEVLFFKYYPNYRVLAVKDSRYFDVQGVPGLTVDLLAEGGVGVERLLSAPKKIKGVTELLKQKFNIENYKIKELKFSDVFFGFFVIFSDDKSKEERVRPQLRHKSVEQKCLSLLTQSKLDQLGVFDDVTGELNRTKFFSHISDEIKRARRTFLPVSLLIISLDENEILRGDDLIDHKQVLLKTVSQIISKTCRVNDVLGRISDNEFALMLPHTSFEGALIKAERLRAMVEDVDFSKPLSRDTKVTLSIGVSEYPSFCHDSRELFTTADGVLEKLMKASENQVGVVQVSESFTPDFLVKKI